MTNTDCPFCTINPTVEVLAETREAMAVLDSFPVNPGHTLIIPRRHVASYFDLTSDEQQALWQLVNTTRILLENHYHPDGFTIGINVGATAGQSVMHVHIHLIPRYKGDVEKPKGGVRGVIPGKQSY